MSADSVDEYLKLHGLGPLFEAMTAALLLHKPADPCKFLAEYLTGLQKQGAQPVLTREDLRVMFGMFDVTEKGVVSVAQANQVFVTHMHSALRAAVPAVIETTQ